MAVPVASPDSSRKNEIRDGEEMKYPLKVKSEAELMTMAATVANGRRVKLSGGKNGGRPRVLPYCECGAYPLKKKPVGHICEVSA